MRTGQLPEKPWTVEAVARLLAAIIICILIGAVVAAVIAYIGVSPHKSPLLFIAGTAGAFVCFGGAIRVLAKPWPFEKYLRNLLVLLVCVYGGFLLMFAIGRLSGNHPESQNSTVRALIAVLSFQGAALILVQFFLRQHHTNWTEGFGLNVNLRRAVLLGLGAGVVVLPTVLALQGISVVVLERLTIHPQEQEAVEILRATESWSNRFILGIATIIIAPVAEEVIFRGILYPAIKRTGHPRIALWGTAVLFGLIHLNLATFVPLTFLALVLVLLYEYTGNLLTCITVHSFFNAANFVALYYQK